MGCGVLTISTGIQELNPANSADNENISNLHFDLETECKIGIQTDSESSVPPSDIYYNYDNY